MKETCVSCFGYKLVEVDLDRWCEENELEVFEGDCPECGAKVIVNVPFEGEFEKGLASEPCECGNKNTPFTYVDSRLTAAMFDKLVEKLSNEPNQTDTEAIFEDEDLAN